MGNGEKKKKKHPAEALHRKMALASECCAFSKDLTCVCVCVFKCVEMSSAFLLRVCFFFEVRRVSRPSITLRARHRFFSPRRFFCKPEQQHVDQNPRVSFMKSQCDIF